mmetsp:Transcript_4226/g.6309  ORF Transcript_4226/g.6309 Transcript_4226/m.6309 type:complete len:401 (-) Transcript_4226:78-1280(-)
MKYLVKSAVALSAFALYSTDAFTISFPSLLKHDHSTTTLVTQPIYRIRKPQPSRLKSFRLNEAASGGKDEDEEIERLRTMAAKLRAEVASLEADKAQQLADAADKAFREFDTNQDGEISLEELKAGLERALKTELSESRVQELMREFDASGDGALQRDEFVGLDKFKNQLEKLVREEKRLAQEAKNLALKEQKEAELAQARLEILNDKAPTATDKVFSVVPYLFPLLDGLAYGRFLLVSEQAQANPVVFAIATLYALYRSLPFGGLIAFFILNFFSGNPKINRLVRFNMQQAIFIDISLFFPSLLTGIIGLALAAAEVELPSSVVQLSTDAIFLVILATLGYCTVSSLLGIEPNKVPIVSKAVSDRMPSADMFDIDSEGRIIPKKPEEENKGDNKDDEKK